MVKCEWEEAGGVTSVPSLAAWHVGWMSLHDLS